MHALYQFLPQWRTLQVYESSPNAAASEKLQAECEHLSTSHYFPGVDSGAMHQGYRCENLERLTYADESFDLVITQDVFEHVLDPQAGLAEVSRVLRPGGVHLFTVPWHYWQRTVKRAERGPDGTTRHLLEPEFHGDPFDSGGSLVVTEWGIDMFECIDRWAGMKTLAVRTVDRRLGMDAEFLEVFLCSKPPHSLLTSPDSTAAP
jgi:SAM-dependent methyltransferase